MKLLTVLLGLCFMFSVSTKVFATTTVEKTKTTTTTVADAKDAKAEVKADGATCACGKSGKDCTCKDCGCSKDEAKSCANHKDGKACGCAHKDKKSKS